MKKTLITIPTYWKPHQFPIEDIPYDYSVDVLKKPPLDKLLNTIKILKDKDFSIAILANTLSHSIDKETVEKINTLTRKIKKQYGIDCFLVTEDKLNKIKKILRKKTFNSLFGFYGYSKIRNTSLIIGQALDADILISIDDDEYFNDPDFIRKARENIGKKIKGKEVHGIGGYYLYENASYYMRETKDSGNYWEKAKVMNKAFDNLIKKKPRLKDTPLILGGNMVLSRNLFTNIPFDPGIPRGEDIDYLINAKMFGYNIFFDNQLSIIHNPVHTGRSKWKTMRVDFYRFLYEQKKIMNQKNINGLKKVKISDLEPYPASFLVGDLRKRFLKSQEFLLEKISKKKNPDVIKKIKKNIRVAKSLTIQGNPFNDFLKYQAKWKKLSELLNKDKIKNKIVEIIES